MERICFSFNVHQSNITDSVVHIMNRGATLKFKVGEGGLTSDSKWGGGGGGLKTFFLSNSL